MSNIKDVANLAGVSVATVSRYINDKGYVSEKSKQKIKDAINQLDYKPNLIARSLSTKQDNTIGLILPDITNPFFPELARAIEDVCIEKGYTVILCNTDNDAKKERAYVEKLLQKYVAGLIITTNLLESSEYEKLNIPIVGLDRVQNIPFPIVTTDNDVGGKLAAETLISKGCQNILILGGPENINSSLERIAGFLSYSNQFEHITVKVIPSFFNYKKTYDIVLKALQMSETIDGIFACSDTDGVAAIKAARTLQYEIPNNLQVVGFDGVSLGEVTSPSLTTIAQNIYEMGELAAEKLIMQIEGKENIIEHIKIAPQLILRESTRKENKDDYGNR
ncbi:transcriptional regulator [Solibacillus sp. R5-41]|uniref:LacI family DNA-binding transcriptional regulator n=1 Tax=Solibacillus sp. R5-41 TaxID=2048654 RepID=UPI000C1298F6|nr:LacI family DNA-binding transcriptional regulator [Solibacillus sp. R5-41]ATP41422.1 transcriptional regulator [Solibacillus sp. R5-41]